MAYTVVEILALIFALVILVKMLFLAFSPKSWTKMVKCMTKNHHLWQIIYILLAAIVLYFLLMEMTFLQVMAAFVFGVLLIGVTFWEYPKVVEKMVPLAFKKKPWLSILIYLVLALYTLYIIFM